MSTQTVFRYTSRTGIQALQSFQELVPEVNTHEVLIKIRSVSLNYRDIAIANDTYPLSVKDNVIPCSDMAGEIVQIGEHVHGFAVGDRVIAHINPHFLYGAIKGPTIDHTLGGAVDGVLREYISLPAHGVIKLPKSAHTFAQWAALPGTGSTVWNSFYGNNPLKPGDTVLILGTGGVSLTALIFAKAAGVTTIITSSSDDKLAYVKSTYGADHTINYKKIPNWSTEVQRLTNGEGVDHVIEVSGVGTMQQSLDSVAYGGIISVIGFLTESSQENMPNVAMSALVKNCVVRGILSGSKQQLEEVVRYVAGRGLPTPIDKTFNFDRESILAALEYVESGKHMGKVCINLD